MAAQAIAWVWEFFALRLIVTTWDLQHPSRTGDSLIRPQCAARDGDARVLGTRICRYNLISSRLQ